MRGRVRSIVGGLALTVAVSLTAACGSTSAVSVGHVHNLALDGDRLVLGTHEGLWEQMGDGAVAMVASVPFDVMGLARDGDRWLASGHPGRGMDAPSDLGLLESLDSGVSWQSVSLSGDVDFHRLVASGSTVMGMSAHDGVLLSSADDGRSWANLGTPPLYDLALSPQDPGIVVATTQDGPVRSVDGGRTFTPIAGAPFLALLAWSDESLYAVGVDGEVHSSTDAGLTWTARGSLGGEPIALAADGGRVAGLVGDTVLYSVDGGVSFSPRLTGVGSH